MRAYLAKHGRGFLPASAEAEKIHGKMEIGECAEVRIIRPRSLQWHRMYFGICGCIGQNQDPQRSADSVDTELRIRAGHYDVMHVDDHEIRYPRRIAFDKLTADEWSALWPSLELAIRQHFGDGYLRESSSW